MHRKEIKNKNRMMDEESFVDRPLKKQRTSKKSGKPKNQDALLTGIKPDFKIINIDDTFQTLTFNNENQNTVTYFSLINGKATQEDNHDLRDYELTNPSTPYEDIVIEELDEAPSINIESFEDEELKEFSQAWDLSLKEMYSAENSPIPHAYSSAIYPQTLFRHANPQIRLSNDVEIDSSSEINSHAKNRKS